MAVFAVSWNLNKEKSNYNAARAAFIAHLERYPHTRDPALETVWFIQSSASTKVIQDDLVTKLDKNDGLLLTRLRSGEYGGWISTQVWEWIAPRL